MLKKTITAVVLIAGLVVLTRGTGPKVRASTGCDVSSLSGTYGFASDGLIVAGSDNRFRIGAGYVPLAFAGTFTFDGSGGVSDAHTTSFGGTIFSLSGTGAYTVNSDCTGAATFSGGEGTWNLVIVDGGKEIKFLVAETGRVVSGTMRHQ